jgi:metal-responsive CopG/Arc/MetJ family transcriptional regulator
MNTITLKVPDNIKEKLNTFSKKKGLSKSEIIRNALLEYLDKDDLFKQGSFMDFAADLAGTVNDKSDLSTNKDYLNEYGR